MIKTLQELRKFLLSMPQSHILDSGLGCEDAIKMITVLWKHGRKFKTATTDKLITVYHIDDLVPTHIKMVTDEIEYQKSLDRRVLVRRVTSGNIPSDLINFGYDWVYLITRIQCGYKGSTITPEEYEEFIGSNNKPTRPEEVIWLKDKDMFEKYYVPKYGIDFLIKGRTYNVRY